MYRLTPSLLPGIRTDASLFPMWLLNQGHGSRMNRWSRQSVEGYTTLRARRLLASFAWAMLIIVVAFPLVAFAGNAELEPPTATSMSPTPTPTPAPPTQALVSPTSTALPPTPTSVPPESTPTLAPSTPTTEPSATVPAMALANSVPQSKSAGTPSPTPTPTPTPEPATASHPADHATPSQSLLQSAIPSLQRVVGGEGGHCIQVSASEVVAYPNFVGVRCGNVTAGSGASVITRTIDTPTFGWRYSVTSSTGPWQQLSTRTVFTGNMAAYTAYFGPTEFGTGKYGQLNVTVATDDRDNTAETATLEAQLPDDVVMACDPTVSATGDSIDFGSISRQGAGYSSSTGSIELTLTAASAGCTGTARNWTIQVSASIMDGPGAVSYTH